MKPKLKHEEADLISAIAKRAIGLGIVDDRKELETGLALFHLNTCSLRLKALLETDKVDLFTLDVLGVMMVVNQPDNRFVPRFRENLDYLPEVTLRQLQTKKINDPGYVDAQERHRLHPDTFDVPAQKVLEALKPGDLVKVCHNDERFWVKVTEVEGDKVTGTVDNDLWMPQPFKLGDIISFEKRHIFDLYDE